MLKTVFRIIMIGVGASAIALFVSQNKHDAIIYLWPGQQGIRSESWLLTGSIFAAGLLCGGILFWISSLRLHARIWQQNRQITRLKRSEERQTETASPPALAQQPDPDA